MIQNVCILLLGLAAVAFAQTPTCSCSVLQACSSNHTAPPAALASAIAAFETCESNCASSLIPANIQTCINTKKSAMQTFAQAAANCMFNPANGLCVGTASSVSLPTGGWQHGHWQHGRWQQGHGKSHNATAMTPYLQCVGNCSKANFNHTAGGGAGKHLGGRGGHHGGMFQTCEKNNGCTAGHLNFAAVKTCETSNSNVNVTQVEINFCTCFHTALGLNATVCTEPHRGHGGHGAHGGGHGDKHGN